MTWTATASSLPDDDQTVLIATADGEVWTGYHEADAWFYVSGDQIGQPVTHWMDFPEPPEVKLADGLREAA